MPTAMRLDRVNVAAANGGRAPTKADDMPRYLVERTFPDGFGLPVTAAGEETARGICRINLEEDVNWIQSFVSADKFKTFCIYDGPDPDAIRRAAVRNGLPVDEVTEVRVLDPFFYY